MSLKVLIVGFTVVLMCVAAVTLNAWTRLVAAASAMPLVSLVPDTPEQIAAALAQESEQIQIIAGGEHYKPLQMLVDYPGVENAKLLDSDSATVPDATPVVGVEVNGQHYAFVLAAMLDPRKHIANLLIGETPVSVTYCDLVDCVRVLTSEMKESIPLRVGGLDIDNQLVFALRGERYGQSSMSLPLADYPFKRMTFGQWKTIHPSTKIYLGPDATPADS